MISTRRYVPKIILFASYYFIGKDKMYFLLLWKKKEKFFCAKLLLCHFVFSTSLAKMKKKYFVFCIFYFFGKKWKRIFQQSCFFATCSVRWSLCPRLKTVPQTDFPSFLKYLFYFLGICYLF